MNTVESNGRKYFAVCCCHNVFLFLETSKTFGQPGLYNNDIFLLMIPVFLCLASFFSSECSKYLHIRKKKNVFTEGRKKIFYLTTQSTFYLRLYGVRHMVMDHSHSVRGNHLPPHRLLFPNSTNGYFIFTIP